MKKILILGGSHRDIPLIKASQALGYYVITLGDRDYYLGHNYSDEAIKINFNDLEAIKNIIKDKKIDYLLPGCGEESYLNTVKLSQELKIGNFDSYEVATLVHNKWKFKQFCLKNSISTPNGFYYKNNLELNTLKFPIVVKPTNLSGGKGVQIVNTKNELIESIKYTQKYSNEIFLEEHIYGDLVAYSIFLKKQKIIYGFEGKDDTHLNQYLISSAYPFKFSKVVLTKLKDDIEKIAKLLNLVDGMFHLQIIIKNNIPYIIDVTRRIPGDLYPNLIELNSGVKYSQAVVKSYIGEDITDEFKIQKDDFIIRYVVMANNNGTYKDIFIDNCIKHKIIRRFDIIEKDYLIDDFLTTQISIIFIKLNSYNSKIVKSIYDLIYPIVI